MADREIAWRLLEIGRELRLARVRAGMTQAEVARRAGTSGAQISRIEHGKAPSVTLRQLGRVAAVVGMKLSARAFPAGRRLVDAGQLELFSRLRARASPAWKWMTEVPMPIAGDYRAADALGTIPACRLMVELVTRFIDSQAQTRHALLKQRDLGADRLVMVVLGSTANRRALREAAPALRDSFSLTTRQVLRALAEGRDPGANGIVLL
jgi:transcriptional regulator with XRE-family HTH domain